MADTTWKNEIAIAAAGRTMAVALIIALFGAGNLHAQNDLGSPSLLGGGFEEIPPELDVFGEIPSGAGQHGGFGTDSWVDGGESSDLLLGLPSDAPAPLRSSGTWFRRGFWFVEQDVVVMARELTNREFLLGFDGILATRERLIVDSGDAGVGVSGRFTLGRFLFRDRNDTQTRDHFAEFTFLGLGEWNVNGGISATGNTLLIPFNLTFPLNGFNQTHIQRFTWESQFNSYEFNYRVRRRITHDRLVLESTGEWTRQIDPGNILSYLFGIRYFTLDESFDFVALGFDPSVRQGNLAVQTSNDMIGFQFGGDAIHQRARWSVGVRGKGGAFVNFASVNSRLRQLEPGNSDPNLGPTGPAINMTTNGRADKDVLAFVGDLGVFATYHLRPNVSFRVAFEGLWLSSTASASRQREFSAADVQQAAAVSGVTYLGLSTGMDIYW